MEISHNGVNTASPATINISAAGGGGKIEMNKTSPWDFGQVPTGGNKTDVVRISNTGSINLNISNINLTTGTIFTIESVKNSSGNPVTVPFAIAPSAYVEVTIKFSPTVAGNYNDTLSIGNDGSYAASPATLNLTGTGRAPIAQTFNYTGSVQNWNVPAGVTSIAVQALGAAGGDSYNSSYGGKGGQANATVPVTPGINVGVYVGGAGFPSYNAGPGAGGWNGGGGTSAGSSQSPGTGGGASDIRIGGTALSDRKLVAGAGGGGGYTGTVSNGDAGGGLTGNTGNTWSGYPAGTGGTQTAGGTGGSGAAWGQPSATNGSLGIGGSGQGWSGGGSGGGAGYYGGGGGFISGGGGGSSYIDASGNTNKSTTADVRTGNGQIIIAY